MIEKHSPKYIQIMDVINEWDPVNFFSSPYAPEDEYDIEIDYFLPLLNDAPKEEYAQILSDTFEKYFGLLYTEMKKDDEKAKKAAEKIYRIITGE